MLGLLILVVFSLGVSCIFNWPMNKMERLADLCIGVAGGFVAGFLSETLLPGRTFVAWYLTLGTAFTLIALYRLGPGRRADFT